MSFSSLPHLVHTHNLSQNPTNGNHASPIGRRPTSVSNSTHVNSYSYSASTSASVPQNSVNSSLDTNRRANIPRKPDIRLDVPVSDSPDTLRTEFVIPNTEGITNRDGIVDEYLEDIVEDDETEEGTQMAQQAHPDAGIREYPDASRRTLTVDPYSAEEERIITVLSRKLEQLRECETTIATSPISPTSPVLSPLPRATNDSNSSNKARQALTSLEDSANLIKGRVTESSTTPQLVADTGKEKIPSRRNGQKPISPPILTATAGSFDNCARKGYPPLQIPSTQHVHNRPGSSDSGIYASSPSPTSSSPSSVYAAGTKSPINCRNGGVNATNYYTNGRVKNNDHGRGTSYDYEDGRQVGEANHSVPYNRSYKSHISTLSSPEMSLSTSPCDAYDTRYTTNVVNPNGIILAPNANGTKPTSRPPSSVNGKATVRFEGLQTPYPQSYSQETGRQAEMRVMLYALMQENETLKGRVSAMESNYLRISRLNEAYREELIGYRTRLGLPVDNLIGLASDPLPVSSPSFHRSSSNSTFTSRQGTTYDKPPPSDTTPNHPSYGSYIGNNTINNNTNGNNAYQYHHSSAGSSNASSPSNSPRMLQSRNGQHRNGGSSQPNRNDYIPNGYENGVGVASTAMLSANSTHGVPIPRPLSQVHTKRPLMSVPMSAPGAENPLVYMNGSTSSRTGKQPHTLSTSASSALSSFQSSPPFSSHSSAFFSPSFSATSSAASSASASTNVTSPPSSLLLTTMMLQPTLGVPSRGLSYPLVPPPSLSSSVGSGSGVWDPAGGASGNLSPVDPSGPPFGDNGWANPQSLSRRQRRSRGGSLNYGPGNELEGS